MYIFGCVLIHGLQLSTNNLALESTQIKTTAQLINITWHKSDRNFIHIQLKFDVVVAERHLQHILWWDCE